MKHTNYISGALLLATALFSASCVDDTKLLMNVEKPASVQDMEYLNEYGFLKTYVDRTANPNFKLGGAVAANEYDEKGIIYRLTNANFDEITAGNAMKYASCVADDGSMDFGTVQSFVETAEEAGISVFGHTLAWHSQQNNKYLNGLLADRELEIDPNAALEKEDAKVEFSNYTKFPYYVMGYEPQIINGCLVAPNPDAAWIQYFVMDKVPTVAGRDYKITAKIKATKNGSLNVNMGSWSEARSGSLEFTTEMKEMSVEMKNIPCESCFVVFQPGTFDGEITIESVKVTHSEAPSVDIFTNLVANSDCSSDDASCFKATVKTVGPKDASFTTSGGVRCVVVEAGDDPVNSWDSQFFVTVPHEFETGENYRFSMKMKADKPASASTQAHKAPGGYLHWQLLGNVDFGTDWKDFSVTGTITADQNGMQTVAFNLSEFKEANKYYFADIKFELITSGNTIPLTDEEKKDTLTWAMNNWIQGMMNATAGKVKAWDVVNEPLAGTDLDGDGIYDLQSATRGTVKPDDAKSNFYWQDYMGDVDYVRTAVRAARKYFKEAGGAEGDLKLFINDYNLESDWDNNKKLESLIEWIKKWETDDVKIDGIASQMHVSCYADAATQKSKEEHVVRMLELMAKTGKLVKISELDMGYVNEDGQSVNTSDMTEAQHKAMAAYYQFIIRSYFEIIPAAQRYGITQWCETDSKNDSGWRGGEPTGLWDSDYSRKHTYAGFADGLADK